MDRDTEEVDRGTEEPTAVLLTRYRNRDGEPTCAIDFVLGKVCRFYGTARYGSIDGCILDGQSLRRRNGGKGTLIPLSTCPVWAGEI